MYYYLERERQRKRYNMKKIFLLGLFACAVGACINAYADGYVEQETVKTCEKISINTVKYYDDAYIAPAPKPIIAKPVPCRYATSLEVARKCDCAKPAPKKMAPVRVKTYTEVIDHYQVYQPVVTYNPAGTYATRRFIDAPNPHCGTCAR